MTCLKKKKEGKGRRWSSAPGLSQREQRLGGFKWEVETGKNETRYACVIPVKQSGRENPYRPNLLETTSRGHQKERDRNLTVPLPASVHQEEGYHKKASLQ